MNTLASVPSDSDLEGALFRAWPAAHVETRDGLFLRATGGASRRANAAATFAAPPDAAPEAVVGLVTEFYRSRALRPCIQLGPTSPPGLDAHLAAAGWTIASPAAVYLGATARVPRGLPAGVEGAVLPAPDAAWTFIEVERGRYAALGDAFLAVVTSLGARAGFVVARIEGAPAAAGLVVHDPDSGIAVLAAMRTLDEARRRGAARALLACAAAWAEERAAAWMVLQVERDNEAALRLYEGAGFSFRYDYDFRLAPE